MPVLTRRAGQTPQAQVHRPPGSTKSHRGTVPLARSHPRPAVDGWECPEPLAYPYCTVGLISTSSEDGSNYLEASAALVAPGLLLTAGHVVYNNGEWRDNLIFFPSFHYRETGSPGAFYVCGNPACWSTWIEQRDESHDYALVWMGPEPVNFLGGLGLVWNNPLKENSFWIPVGYPAEPNPPFDELQMVETVAPFNGTGDHYGFPGTIGVTHDGMREGSSGGPWTMDYRAGLNEYANGLQGFYVDADPPNNIYSPYFTADLKTLYDYILDPANH